jgi:DNA-binding NarL/FixJ family response regulator
METTVEALGVDSGSGSYQVGIDRRVVPKHGFHAPRDGVCAVRHMIGLRSNEPPSPDHAVHPQLRGAVLSRSDEVPTPLQDPTSTPGGRAPLTAREVEIVTLVIDGLTNPEIGRRLHISSRTVQSHVAAAMRKLEARSRTQLAVIALRAGVVPLEPLD